MPEPRPGFPEKAAWRICADQLFEQLQRSPRLDDAILSLSRWFDVLRSAPYDALNPDQRLRAAFASETDNPVAWCAGTATYLPAELDGSVGPDAQVEILDPLIRYALGRACMRSMMARPSDTAGLSLAYGLLWPVAHDGIAYAGADDELLDQLAVSPEAKGEIEAEARRLGENPVGAARGFDRDRTVQAIQQASSPKSLEACTHWQIRDGLIDLTFGRVVQVIGSSDTAFASKLLEAIGNAKLVASVISGSGILDILAKANLLRSVEPAFDLKDRWTGRTTAWMILLEIEERLLAPLQEQVRLVRLGAIRPPDPEAVVKNEVDVAAEALLSRPDGPRLALEWLAHLLWSVLLLRTPSRAGGDDLSALDPKQILVKVLGARLGREDWPNPLRVWTLFGGSPLVAGVNDSHGPAQDVPLLLPLWRDWLGQRNTLVPIAVAVHLWDDTVSPPDWLAAWIRLLCRDFEGQSATLQLAQSEPSQASGYLAWPLVRLGLPSERFDELWADASWQLTRARFSKLEQAADVVQPCVALIRIGLRMLELSTHVGANDASALASSLADAIDEVRYTLPEIGLLEWSTLVGKLSGVMAGSGLLKDNGCERLLSRYDGDDDSLAAAAVNAVANGVPAWQVRQALASIGEDATELAGRWATWNDRLAKDDKGRPGNFLAHLLAISEAIAETP